MGKNKKAVKQVLSSKVDTLSPNNGNLEEAPVDFLTSDNFQVVTKRHNTGGKRSEDLPAIPRSRSISERLVSADEDDVFSCHSGFWTARSLSIEDTTAMVNGGGRGKKLTKLRSTGDLVASKSDGSLNGTCEDEESESEDPSESLEVDLAKVSESGDGQELSLKVSELKVKDESRPGGDGDAKVKKSKKSKKKSSDKARFRNVSECGGSSDGGNPKVLVHSSSSEVEGRKDEDEEDEKKKAEERNRKKPSQKQLEMMREVLRKKAETKEMLEQENMENRKLEDEQENETQEKLKLEKEKKERKKLKEKQKKEQLRAEGKLLSKSQKQARARMEATLLAFRQQGVDVPLIGEKRTRTRANSEKEIRKDTMRYKYESLSSQESSSSLSLPSSLESKDSFDMKALVGSVVKDKGRANCSDESDNEHSLLQSLPKKEVLEGKLKDSLAKSNLAKLNSGDANTAIEKKDSVKLRSPVICVLGHVDTGKTKLLDYIRKTHVQDSEAGGITQQIGATMIPREALREKCKMTKDFASFETKVPGLLVIDTPGHESFRNLRSRGTSICDIAILVVDIMHGLEPQTLESIHLLKKSKTPFVVALNKVDRLYGWKSAKDSDIESTVKSQSPTTQAEFKKRCQEIIVQFANECLNAALYYENPDPRTFVSMVPTSAISGDGMGNLLSLTTRLTQTKMHKNLVFSEELEATVLEVKVIAGLGTTIDVILVNGRLNEGDTIVLAGHDGPVVAQIRSLLMPHPLKELRVKNQYVEYKSVEGAQGVKITGKDLDKTLAGLPLFVAQNSNRVEPLKVEMATLLELTVSCIKTSERGVYVQASTLGSLEALLEYLTSIGIPYFAVKVGPVVKKDVTKASIMLEHDPQYATILAFDVKVEKDAQDLAENLGVKIITAKLIYHAGDEFLKHREAVQKKREEARLLAVFPCVLRVLSPASPPTTFDAVVEAGSLHIGTPLCVKTRGNTDLGIVSGIHTTDGSAMSVARENQVVRVHVEGCYPDLATKLVELETEDYLVSRVTKQSVEICKEYCKDDLSPEDWDLMTELRKMLSNHA